MLHFGPASVKQFMEPIYNFSRDGEGGFGEAFNATSIGVCGIDICRMIQVIISLHASY